MPLGTVSAAFEGVKVQILAVACEATRSVHCVRSSLDCAMTCSDSSLRSSAIVSVTRSCLRRFSLTVATLDLCRHTLTSQVRRQQYQKHCSKVICEPVRQW